MILVTVVGGREYTLELRGDTGTVDASLPHLYAVAKGINFSPKEEPGLKLPGKTKVKKDKKDKKEKE